LEGVNAEIKHPIKSEIGVMMSLEKLDETSYYNIWQISRLRDYVEFLESNVTTNMVLFRGQSGDYKLLPQIARLNHRTSVLTSEELIFTALQRQAITFLSPVPSNPWDWLAIAQHHGLPTRLLDWTRNPLAALWFAVRRPPQAQETHSHGVVWVFRPDPEDVIRDVQDAEDPFAGARTKVFEPRHVTARLVAQHGAFTVHKYVSKKKNFISLERNINQRERLEKILVPCGAFSDCRYQLDRCGIHEASLFPDLDGLCRHIHWQHVFFPDENKKEKNTRIKLVVAIKKGERSKEQAIK
jgi:hypothetical protein